MIVKLTKNLLVASVIAMAAPGLTGQAFALETISSRQISKNVTMVEAAGVKVHTFHGISNSHIIETANELRVIDAQFIKPQALGLKKYLASLGKPVRQIILSHNHPDHWFGAQFLSSLAPIATSKNVASELKTGGGRYLKIMGKNPKFKDSVPTAVVVPSQIIALGKQTWDGLEVIVEERTEQESHNSLLIKIPSMGVMIGQDLFYNKMFLVASERKRNIHWREILAELAEKEAKQYKTLLVGHGKNGGPEILTQDIRYLDALEKVMSENLTKEETTKKLIAMFPEMGGKSFLGISMGNLFRGH